MHFYIGMKLCLLLWNARVFFFLLFSGFFLTFNKKSRIFKIYVNISIDLTGVLLNCMIFAEGIKQKRFLTHKIIINFPFRQICLNNKKLRRNSFQLIFQYIKCFKFNNIPSKCLINTIEI